MLNVRHISTLIYWPRKYTTHVDPHVDNSRQVWSWYDHPSYSVFVRWYVTWPCDLPLWLLTWTVAVHGGRKEKCLQNGPFIVFRWSNYITWCCLTRPTYMSIFSGVTRSFDAAESVLLAYQYWLCTNQVKVFPYSLPNVGPGADPGVQAVSPQMTWSESRHMPSSSLPLLSAGPAFTFVAFTRWRYL